MSARSFRWVSTGCTVLVVLAFAASGIAYLARPEPITAGMKHLGYPDYFPVMLGIAKLLAAAAIASPRARRLKEWAYAGLTFDLIAAAIAHALAGDGPGKVIAPLALLAVLAVSYLDFYRRTELTSRA